MPLAKPVYPVWQPGKAPAGCRAYFPLTAYGSTAVRELSGRGFTATLQGTAAAAAAMWGRGAYGPHLGSFTASNYAKASTAGTMIGVYPHWQAALVRNTAVTDGVVTSAGSSLNAAGSAFLRMNISAVAGASWEVVDDNGSTTAIATLATTAVNDGNWHVLFGVSLAATDHRVYLDGRLGATTATSVTTAVATNQVAVGVLARSSALIAFPGAVAAAAFGFGAFPDPAALARDWLSGAFAAVRPGPAAALFAAPATNRLRRLICSGGD